MATEFDYRLYDTANGDSVDADCRIYQGDDWAVVHKVNGVDLTGTTLTGQFRKGRPQAEDAIDADVELLEYVAPGADPDGLGYSRVRVALTNAQTADMSAGDGTYAHDWQAETAGGVVTTYVYGVATVVAQVTRAA